MEIVDDNSPIADRAKYLKSVLDSIFNGLDRESHNTLNFFSCDLVLNVNLCFRLLESLDGLGKVFCYSWTIEEYYIQIPKKIQRYLYKIYLEKDTVTINEAKKRDECCLWEIPTKGKVNTVKKH